MNLNDILNSSAPKPWAEGDNIPWNDPDFSQRMLKEHLSQNHDAASRRSETIDRHVDFIQRQVLGGRTSAVLDLGCGPGLYANRLARLGHSVHGVDFSPASIEYARQEATRQDLESRFTLSDLRVANYGPDETYDLVMLIYGEFNVFKPSDVRQILARAWAALRPGGRLLLEPSTEDATQQNGVGPDTWSAESSGLFSDRPHLVLEQAFWDAPSKAATRRYFIVDAETGQVTRYAASYQAYHPDQLRALLEESGFRNVSFYPSLLGPDSAPAEFMAVLAEK